MSWFWLLCLTVALGGLVRHRELRAVLGDLRLHVFGVRVRARRPQPAPDSDPPLDSVHDRLAPPRVLTRPGP
jgi:hypothetical protein